MKHLIASTLVCVVTLTLSACNEDGQSTTVSKSMWNENTIVSSSASDGTFTRTQYGNDIWGNRQTVVSRGHTNATQQGDAFMLGLELVVGIVSELSK